MEKPPRLQLLLQILLLTSCRKSAADTPFSERSQKRPIVLHHPRSSAELLHPVVLSLNHCQGLFAFSREDLIRPSGV